MRVLVTGGAGFIGSHLCAALLNRGDDVVCVDNLCTGSQRNLSRLERAPGFRFINADVSERIPVAGSVDAVAHLASPASPVDYLRLPLQTLAVGSRGTEHALAVAKASGARFLLASTSEVYGEPAVHPQPETYWGNVNPVGPRSVYDEAKRFAEALTMAHERACGINVGVARIFNTYGPHMRAGDGRVVSNFVTQALSGKPLTVYGDGSQTRSLCYVDDLVRGLVALLNSAEPGPVNLGNPTELTVGELAETVLALTGSSAGVVYRAPPVDDPTRRRPDITLARQTLAWEPTVNPEEGLRRTISWFASSL